MHTIYSTFTRAFVYAHNIFALMVGQYYVVAFYRHNLNEMLDEKGARELPRRLVGIELPFVWVGR